MRGSCGSWEAAEVWGQRWTGHRAADQWKPPACTLVQVQAQQGQLQAQQVQLQDKEDQLEQVGLGVGDIA